MNVPLRLAQLILYFTNAFVHNNIYHLITKAPQERTATTSGPIHGEMMTCVSSSFSVDLTSRQLYLRFFLPLFSPEAVLKLWLAHLGMMAKTNFIRFHIFSQTTIY